MENRRRAGKIGNLPQRLKKIDPDIVLGAPRQAAPPASAAPKEQTAIGIVARGRSVEIPTGERRIVGYDGKNHCDVSGALVKRYGPGARVELPISELKRLQGLGFIVDPATLAVASAAVKSGGGANAHLATLPRR